jgi:hypothetical protein
MKMKSLKIANQLKFISAFVIALLNTDLKVDISAVKKFIYN